MSSGIWRNCSVCFPCWGNAYQTLWPNYSNELRTQATAASKYHAQVDSRLASLPDEIAGGVDIEAMANNLAESFRQQLATTLVLETTANLLRNSSREITALSGQISASLKPTAQEYKRITATISAS